MPAQAEDPKGALAKLIPRREPAQPEHGRNHDACVAKTHGVCEAMTHGVCVAMTHGVCVAMTLQRGHQGQGTDSQARGKHLNFHGEHEYMSRRI
eukprot:1142314-Pelagomonas_calceolata.AAC.2